MKLTIFYALPDEQAQYSYTVIQLLMAHLDNKYSSQSRTFHMERTGIVKVLYHIVNIAASESVGPSVLDIFHSLLNHLKRWDNRYISDPSKGSELVA